MCMMKFSPYKISPSCIFTILIFTCFKQSNFFFYYNVLIHYYVYLGLKKVAPSSAQVVFSGVVERNRCNKGRPTALACPRTDHRREKREEGRGDEKRG